jgi:hypothetical protein
MENFRHTSHPCVNPSRSGSVTSFRLELPCRATRSPRLQNSLCPLDSSAKELSQGLSHLITLAIIT